MHKRKVKILKRDHQPAATQVNTVSSEQEIKVNIERDIGDVVGDWINQRRDNRRRERKDSGETIREWTLGRRRANDSEAVDASVSLPAACGLDEEPEEKRLTG